MATALKIEITAGGNIALRVFSDKGGRVKLVNEIALTPAMAEKYGARMIEAAQQLSAAQSGVKEGAELDALDDDDLED